MTSTRFLGVTWFIQVKKSNKNHYFSIKIRKIFKKVRISCHNEGNWKFSPLLCSILRRVIVKKILTWENTVSVNFRFSYWSFWFLFLSTWIWRKKDTHAFIRYGGNGEVYPPPTPTRPLGITRPLPDITPTRLRPNCNCHSALLKTETVFLNAECKTWAERTTCLYSWLKYWTQ